MSLSRSFLRILSWENKLNIFFSVFPSIVLVLVIFFILKRPFSFVGVPLQKPVAGSIYHINTTVRFTNITNRINRDEEEGVFRINMFVDFDFDPTIISPDVIGKFYFLNGHIINQADPHITNLSNGNVRYSYYITFQLLNKLDYKNFPLDRHVIVIELINPHIDASKALYHVDSACFHISFTNIGSFNIVKKDIDAGRFVDNDPCSVNEYSALRVMFGVEREGINFLFLIFLPLLALLFFSMICITFINFEDYGTAIGSMVASYTALLMYHFVIDGYLPSAGIVTFADYVFYLVFVIADIITIMVFINYLYQKKKKKLFNVINVLSIPLLNLVFMAGVLSWYFVMVD